MVIIKILSNKLVNLVKDLVKAVLYVMVEVVGNAKILIWIEIKKFVLIFAQKNILQIY